DDHTTAASRFRRRTPSTYSQLTPHQLFSARFPFPSTKMAGKKIRSSVKAMRNYFLTTNHALWELKSFPGNIAELTTQLEAIASQKQPYHTLPCTARRR